MASVVAQHDKIKHNITTAARDTLNYLDAGVFTTPSRNRQQHFQSYAPDIQSTGNSIQQDFEQTSKILDGSDEGANSNYLGLLGKGSSKRNGSLGKLGGGLAFTESLPTNFSRGRL